VIVSVVVPMKDEEGSLPLLARELDGLADRLRERGHELEAVLVDDGSEDGTAEVARALSAERPHWRLLQHARNRGFGAGFRTGAEDARGEVIVSYDADCAYPADDVVRLLDALDGGAQIAAATPFADGGEARAAGWRLLISRACSFAYRLVLRGRAHGIHTFTCAFRAYRADVLRATPWRGDGFLAAAEILSRALLAGVRVIEVPSTLRARTAGQSKMRIVRVAFAHLGLLARLAVSRAPASASSVMRSGAPA
jgi:dolichol-phosphate mannosyltransferase